MSGMKWNEHVSLFPKQNGVMYYKNAYACGQHCICYTLQINKRRIADDSRIRMEQFETQYIKHHVEQQGAGYGNDISQRLSPLEEKPADKHS